MPQKTFDEVKEQLSDEELIDLTLAVYHSLARATTYFPT